jgi:hypothetical protein
MKILLEKDIYVGFNRPKMNALLKLKLHDQLSIYFLGFLQT